MTEPSNVTVSLIAIPLIYLLGVNASVLIDVTDREALNPCLVGDMGGAPLPFTKGDPLPDLTAFPTPQTEPPKDIQEVLPIFC